MGIDMFVCVCVYVDRVWQKAYVIRICVQIGVVIKFNELFRQSHSIRIL